MGRRMIKASYQLIVTALTNGNTINSFIVDNGLPKSATIVDAYCESEHGDVCVIFEDPSWESTPDGSVVAVIDPVLYLHKWEGPFSLWSCNGCDWLGYLNDTLPCEHEPADHLCPVCRETCELVTDEYVRRIKEIGMHYMSGVQLSEEMKAYIDNANIDAWRNMDFGIATDHSECTTCLGCNSANLTAGLDHAK